jgi:hypothetical protein
MVSPSLISFLDDAEGDIGNQWRDHPALGRALVRRQQEAVRKNASLQEAPDQSRHLEIADASAHVVRVAGSCKATARFSSLRRQIWG